jgi:hypothetical protein
VPLPVYNTVHMMMPTYLQRIKMAAGRLKPCELSGMVSRQVQMLAASKAEADKAQEAAAAAGAGSKRSQ